MQRGEVTQAIFDVIERGGTSGATVDEIVFALGWSPKKVAPRIYDLISARRVYDCGLRRRTRAGRRARVLRVTEDGGER